MKITEEEIRPEVVFNEYLKLTAEDTVTYFAKAEKTKLPVLHVAEMDMSGLKNMASTINFVLAAVPSM